MHRRHLLVFGLSADPLHEGHVSLVVQAVPALRRRDFTLAGVLLVPLYRRNPVGSSKAGLPQTFAHRLALCRLGAEEIHHRLEELPPVRASRIEERLARGREAPNYTAETLATLDRRIDPACGLIFLLSADLLAGAEPEFARWREPERIARLATLALAPRPGYAVNRAYVRHLEAEGGRVVLLDEVETPAVSGTELRRRLHAGEPPARLAEEGLLPPGVARYLEDHPLYGEDAPPPQG